MSVKNRSSIVSLALKTLVGAVASAVLISAHAAGLGKLTVLSALGQPLRAEIELSAVTPEEAGGLSVRLAPSQAFRTANIDFNPVLYALRFEVERRNGRPMVRVSSTQPLNEPFVDMLLELNWNGGRMVREYTFLLDPPEMRSAQAPQVAAPVDVGQARKTPGTTAPATAPVAAREAAAARASAEPAAVVAKPPAEAAAVAKPPAEPAAAVAKAPDEAAAIVAKAPAEPAADAKAPAAKASAARPAAKAAAEEVTVKRGDTLTAIAGQVKPVDVSLDVMLVALYRANPEAFMGNNMNRLKSGQVLAVPDAAAIRSAGADAAARSEARGVVVAHARDFNAYRARLAGQVANSTASKDAGTGQNSSGKITAKVEEKPNAVNAARDKLTLSKATAEKPGEGKTGAAVEDKIARQKQVDEAASRVKELEKNVNDLEKLMEVKSKSTATAPAAPAVAAVPRATASIPAAAEPAKARMAPVIPPRKLEEPGLFDKLMANSQMVGLLVASLLVAVVAALAVVAARRRRKPVVTRDEPGPDGLAAAPAWDPAPPAPAADAAVDALEPVVDDDQSIFDTRADKHFAPSATQLDNNEVDPVAEADVYIAYGRDAQAEEILKEALRNHPERHAVRLKLLEIYANRQDGRTFESQASELYSLTRGQGDEWAQAARMGRELEPGNPLYASPDSDGADGFGAAPLAASAGVVAAATAAAAYAAYDHDDAEAAAADAATDTAPAAYAAALNDDLETALPQAADATLSPASVAAQANAADFGLGDLDFAAPDPYAQDPLAKVAADSASFLPDLDFNLPYDKPVTPAPAEESAYDPSMDFSLDLPAEPVALTKAAPAADAAATRVPLDFDAADLTIPDLPALAVPPAEPEPAPEPVPEPVPAPAPAVAEKDAAPEFDLSGIDFDLNSQPEPAQAVETGRAETGRAEPMSALQMEMDTKLDLAVAYQEIGDKEGARELLDEVLRGGSDEQVAKATTMKEQLG